MNDLEKLAREALRCLRLEVDKSIADDVERKVLDWATALQRAVAEKDKEIARLKEACRKEFETVERLDAAKL